jgi:phosphoribosyl-dephospho-CoA transferase
MPLALLDKTHVAPYSIANIVTLERHQLVWLTDLAWQHIQARHWDAPAHGVLAHWRAQQLPLVVTRQRADVEPDSVCLGLPAATHWAKRKLALTVPLGDIFKIEPSPTLGHIAAENALQPNVLALNAALNQCGVQAHVHGSYAWQHLTGLAYLHPDSDLDLHLPVTQFSQATQVIDLLANLPRMHPTPRLDGEIIFTGGQAVAWRELRQLLDGQVSQVLLKDFRSARLVSQAYLRDLCKHCSPLSQVRI